MQHHDKDDAKQDAALRVIEAHILATTADLERLTDPTSPEMQIETRRAVWRIQNRQRAERRALQRIRVAYRGIMR